MLGSACEADGLVEDALTRLVDTRLADIGPADALAAGAAPDPARDPRAWLIGEVLGASLAALESSRSRREAHIGPWLPEPVLTGDGALGTLESAEEREAVSMARLVVLERLSAAERAAYVLRESFGYRSAEAAALLGLSEARCRALRLRARRRVRESGTRAEETGAQRWQLVEELARAVRDADGTALAEMLAEDVVAWSDGGQTGTARRPVLGAAKVGRFLAGLSAKAPAGTQGCVAEVNGDAAVVAVAGAGVMGVVVPEFGPQGLVGIRMVADPQRLVFLSRQWAGRATG